MKNIVHIFRSRWTKGLSVLALCLLLVPGDAFAVTSSIFGGNNEVTKAFADILAIFVNLMTFLALVMLDWGGQLMGTEMLTNDTIESALLPIWRLIRNFTNLAFVFVLIFLALANIVSSFTGQGNWTIKEKLPRIIFAMVAINFSYLGMKVLLDAVHVGTTAILSIADTSLQSVNADHIHKVLTTEVAQTGNGPLRLCGGSGGGGGGGECKPYYQWLNEAMCEGGPGDDKCHFCVNIEGSNCGGNGVSAGSKPDPSSKASHTSRNLMMAFSVHFMQLEKLVILPPQVGTGNPLGVLQNFSFSMLMSLLYVIVLAAVFIALLFRVVVLWLVIIFSPALLAVNIMGIGGSFGELNKKFVTNLIMPMKIAAAFAISFVLIVALSSFEGQLLAENGSGSTGLIAMGPIYKQYFVNEYGLLWQVMTIVVFWMSAWWALQGSEAEFIINKIKSGAENTGKFAAKAATIDRQIIPMPFGDRDNKTASLGSLMGAPKQFERMYEQRERGRRTKDWKSWGIMDGATEKFEKAVEKINADKINGHLEKPGGNTKDEHVAKYIDEFIRENGKDSLRDKDVNDALVRLLQSTDFTGRDDLIKEISSYRDNPGTIDDGAIMKAMEKVAPGFIAEIHDDVISNKRWSNSGSSGGPDSRPENAKYDYRGSSTGNKLFIDQTTSIEFKDVKDATTEADKITKLNDILEANKTDRDVVNSIESQLAEILENNGIDRKEAANYKLTREADGTVKVEKKTP